MLYDPKWDNPSNQLNLDALISWLERQPPEERYDFFCVGKCLIGQWVRSIDPWAHPAYFTSSNHYIVNGEEVCLDFLVNRVACDSSRISTFGAALKRARALKDNGIL